MPLAMAPEGEEMKVTKVIADEKTKRHLENLGILAGAKLTLLTQSNGNVILRVKDGKIAINRTLAAKIFVAQ